MNCNNEYIVYDLISIRGFIVLPKIMTLTKAAETDISRDVSKLILKSKDVTSDAKIINIIYVWFDWLIDQEFRKISRFTNLAKPVSLVRAVVHYQVIL